MDEKWIQTKNLYALLGLEPFLLLSSLVALAWGFYKIFLVGVSEERHKSLRGRFRIILKTYVPFALLFSTTFLLRNDHLEFGTLERLSPYIAVMTFILGGVVFVQVSRLIILQYLFLGSMRAGVPILLVNIFSLVLSALLIFWGASQIFGIQLGPLVATSAAFSIILGLAMQDTLGNLFAGIALQIDHVFEIGDWLEINAPQQKIVGQVKEITWRAVTLIGWSDEVIVVPNRVVAGSSLSNFQNGDLAVIRSQVFRLPLGTDPNAVKPLLLNAISSIDRIRKYPEPVCFVSEITDSWMTFKVAYYINNFGSQFAVGDQVLTEGLSALHKAGFQTAHATTRVLHRVLES